MRRAAIEAQDRFLVRRQQEFRLAADVVAQAWAAFEEVAAVAVIGSVARPLWKEVPRFAEFRRAGIALWHECGDLDLALWLDHQQRLGELRQAANRALRAAQEGGRGITVASHQLDVFLIEPGTDRHLGRLCDFNRCPRGRPECATPGCGATAFNKRVPDFAPRDDLLSGAEAATLYRRGAGVLRSALDLPPPGA